MGANVVLIDTSIWILALRPFGPENVRSEVDRLIDEGSAATTGIIKTELLGGARTLAEKDELSQNLEEGLHYLETPDIIWKDSADINFRLRRKGISVALPDIVIAAIAIRHNCILLHEDNDFGLIASHTKLKVRKIRYRKIAHRQPDW